MAIKDALMDFFRKKPVRPLSIKEIGFAMGIGRAEHRPLKRALEELSKSGQIIRTRNGLFAPSEDLGLVSGHFEAHKDGYGFVIPEKPGEKDLFIPPGMTLSAMDNDRVVARLEDSRKRQGRIIRILQRVHTKVSGTLDISREGCYVRPKNKKIPFDISIPREGLNAAKHGENVVVEITGYHEKRPPTGEIVKVIKTPDEPKAEIEAVIEEAGLPKRFHREALEEAKLLVSKPIEKSKKRKDLTSLPMVTIDGERAKDFDDAVSIALDEHGYRLWVHIADVAHFVPWDSAIDLEARRRGTSVYFPDRVIPMLPKELSEDLCSLRPGVPRAAITVEMVFDRFGNRTSEAFYHSLIKSRERMTYTSVRKILVDSDEIERQRYEHLLRDFELMSELCGVLREKRLGRGSLDFDLPEPEVLLDLQGRPEAIIRSERNLAHMMIEEFMVAANEAVATHLFRLGMPSLYRIHEEPDPMKIENVFRLAKVPAKQPRRTLPYLLKSVKGKPEEEAVTYLVLRGMKRAKYSHENAGHFGLASNCYTHFTSPIRRYPDLVVHRILSDVIERKTPSSKRLEWLERCLPDIAFSSSHTERVAADAESDVIDAMRMWFMKDKVGDEFEGKVVSVTPYGLKIRLNEFFVEGFLHVSFMDDDFYRFDEGTLTLKGKRKGRSFGLGHKLSVRVDKINLEEREIVFGT